MFQLDQYDLSLDRSNCFSLKIKCPGCFHAGTFERLANLEDVKATRNDAFDDDYRCIRIGIRMCPAHDCRMLVFFTSGITGSEVQTHPLAAPDFDPTNLPDKVVRAFEESLKCYEMGCYAAAALMVRKTVEEVCHDLGFNGTGLVQRIEELKARVSLPPDLLDSLHDLRLLGNDAAHAEVRNFEEVGKEELGASIDVMKELLKGLYQYKALKEKLGALKKSRVP